MKSVFEGKRIVITGSSRGIGRKLTESLLRQGASVLINGRDPVRLERTRQELESLCAFPGQLEAAVADVSIYEEAKALADFTQSKFGTVDILINNAGLSMRGLFEEITCSTVESLIRANLLSAVYTTRAFIPLLRHPGASVVFVSTLAAVRGFPMVSLYSMAKMSLTGLAQSLRAEWRDKKCHIGVVYLSFTENDPAKTILTADGRSIHHERKSAMTQVQAAEAVLKNLRLRRQQTVVTLSGHFLVWLQRWFPALLDWFLGSPKNEVHNFREKP